MEGDSRKNASGADSDATPYDGGVPYRWEMPETPEWGIGDEGKSSGGYGHSRDVVETTDVKAWGMKASDVDQGYERSGAAVDRSGYGYNHSIPETNVHDRGAGAESRAKEFKSAEEGRGFDGRGNDKSSPGKEQLGSSRFPEA